jgi:hypothetical protein
VGSGKTRPFRWNVKASVQQAWVAAELRYVSWRCTPHFSFPCRLHLGKGISADWIWKVSWLSAPHFELLFAVLFYVFFYFRSILLPPLLQPLCVILSLWALMSL